MQLNTSCYIGVLGYLGNKCLVEPLINKLRDESTLVRRSTIRALGQLGDVRAVEPLIKIYDGKNRDDLYEVRAALEKLLPKLPVNKLLLLKCKNVRGRCLVLETLDKTGDERAIKPLIAVLDDKDRDISSSAYIALKQLGRKNLVFLTKELQDEKPGVRYNVSVILGEIGDEKAIAPIEKLLKIEKNERVKEKLKDVLESLKKKNGTSPESLFGGPSMFSASNYPRFWNSPQNNAPEN